MTDTSDARNEVMKCEQEIQSIKAALRRIGNTSTGPDAEQNTMEILLLKVEGFPPEAKPVLTLQLSSPIEEGTLTTIYDPSNPPDSTNQGSTVMFRGVETSNATLTATAKDADIPLGSSIPHEVSPLCALDPLDIKDEYVTDLPLAIVAEEATDKQKSEKIDSETKEEYLTIQPVCTVTLRIIYKPSPKDQREELYELLNKTSQRKATALENLRQISMQTASNRSPSDVNGPLSTSQAGSGAVATKPSVKPGFLNKTKKEEGTWKRLYDRMLGPNSILRNGAFFAFASKDFIIFFGAVTFFHFKGQMLALPPPV